MLLLSMSFSIHVNVLLLSLSSSIHVASAWEASTPKLPEVAQKLVDDYVAWHNKAGNEKHTRLVVHRPVNGLGDQILNFVTNLLHGCVVLHAEGKSVRFEIRPAHGDSYSDFTGPAKDVGAWTAGLDSRIDFVHDPERAKRLEQVVEERTTPCWHGQCDYFRHDPRISREQAMYAILLRPSMGTQALMKKALPMDRPGVLIGLHTRTWVLTNAWEHRATPELLEKHNRPIFEFKPARRLYKNIVAGTAKSALKAARKAAKGRKPNEVSVFVASDHLPFTQDVEKYLRDEDPNLIVGSVPARPVWSHRAYDTTAGDKDFEAVWATWFALAEADTLSVGNSMFSESATYIRVNSHPTVEFFSTCFLLGWLVLNQFAEDVSKGSTMNMKTLAQAFRTTRRRASYSDFSCFTKKLQKEFGIQGSDRTEL